MIFLRVRLIHKETGEIIESPEYFSIKSIEYKTMHLPDFPYEVEDILSSKKYALCNEDMKRIEEKNKEYRERKNTRLHKHHLMDAFGRGKK